MNFYRTQIHGRLIEVRRGDFGGEYIFVDGLPVSERPLAGWKRSSHHFDITDASGAARHVEIVGYDRSGLGLATYRYMVMVDGVERARLEPIDLSKGPTLCPNCGYELRGLPVDNGEVRCPECGRHSPAPPQD